MSQLADYLEVCESAARAGGAILVKWQGRIRAREKAPKDLVTEADLESQRVIRRILLDAFPDHRFIGEEEDDDDAPSAIASRLCWYVDPLDGTANYVHQLPTYAVSVALFEDGAPLVGTVFDPVLDECYLAARGGGATCNGAPLRTSNCEELSQALLAASFSANVRRGSAEIDQFVAMIEHCRAVRRLGSAALNLCYLAAGRLDGYWASSVKVWDIAAGWLMVDEAGGIMTNPNGGPLDLDRPHFTSAATPALHQKMMQVLQKRG